MSCCGSSAQKLPSSISSRYNCCREVSHSSLLPHAGTTNIVPLERYGVWSGGRKHMGGRGGCRKSEVGRALSSSQNWNKGWKNLCHVRIPVTSSAEEARTSPTSRHEPPHQKHIWRVKIISFKTPGLPTPAALQAPRQRFWEPRETKKTGSHAQPRLFHAHAHTHTHSGPAGGWGERDGGGGSG